MTMPKSAAYGLQTLPVVGLTETEVHDVNVTFRRCVAVLLVRASSKNHRGQPQYRGDGKRPAPHRSGNDCACNDEAAGPRRKDQNESDPAPKLLSYTGGPVRLKARSPSTMQRPTPAVERDQCNHRATPEREPEPCRN